MMQQQQCKRLRCQMRQARLVHGICFQAVCRKRTGVQHSNGWELRCANSHSNSSTSHEKARPHKIILGIESSCDDTGAAVVSSDGTVLGEALATQAEIHAPWGGVVPNLAMEAHKAAIDQVVDQALAKAGIRPEQLDAVAVTVGPGLSPCLRVGALKAVQLSSQYQLPLVKVHHMEAHALVARMTSDLDNQPQFPFLCLLVSGGHNLIVLVRGVGQYVQLGTTLDDALGEAYDKVARLLGLDLRPSGGAALEACAKHGNPIAFKFAVPMRKYANCDFSFAGLKTSTRLAIEANLGKAADTATTANTAQSALPNDQTASSQDVSSQSNSEQTAVTPTTHEQVSDTTAQDSKQNQIKADIAASFQHVATQHLVERMSRAATWAKELDPNVRHLVVAGGVACNQHIRSQLAALAEKAQLQLVLPPPKWCTDNGAMVAWAGIERLQLGLIEQPEQAPVAQQSEDMWIDVRARWPLTSRKHPRCETADARTAPNVRQEGKIHHKAEQYGMRSARKARMHTSLTDMTEQELAGRSAVGADFHDAREPVVTQ